MKRTGPHLEPRRGRTRAKAALLGVVAAALVATIGVLLLGESQPDERPREVSEQPQTRLEGSVRAPAAWTIPEGQLLLAIGGRVELLPYGSTTSYDVGDPSLVPYDLSPDGSKVAATTEQREPTGISRQTSLWAIDASTGDGQELATASNRESFVGPIRWAPDGQSLAFRLAQWDMNVTRVHPGPRTEVETVCVLELSSTVRTCAEGVGKVYDFDWSPGGRALVLSGPGPQPLRVLDVGSGEATELVSLDDPTLLGALQQAGLGAEAVQFVGPLWSPSGEYVAVLVGGRVPAVFQADGTFVTLGHPSREFPHGQWSPTEDAFAYTTGRPPYRVTKVYVMDPGRDTDDLLLSTGSDVPNTTVSGLAWSPSGRWLAIAMWMGRRSEIRIIDTTGMKPDRVLRFDAGGVSEPLRDWGPIA